MENDQNNQLSNKERHELKRQEKLHKQNLVARKRAFQRGIKMTAIVLVIVGGIGGLVWYVARLPKTPESEIVSRNGIHWHPRLAIFIKGLPQEIPANLGMSVGMAAVHTHDTTGTLHLEIPGLVTKKNTTLAQFFKIWGKPFNSNCLLEFCNGPDGKIKMTVNGKENSEFENYPMKDNDQIEIRYE